MSLKAFSFWCVGETIQILKRSPLSFLYVKKMKKESSVNPDRLKKERKRLNRDGNKWEIMEKCQAASRGRCFRSTAPVEQNTGWELSLTVEKLIKSTTDVRGETRASTRSGIRHNFKVARVSKSTLHWRWIGRTKKRFHTSLPCTSNFCSIFPYCPLPSKANKSQQDKRVNRATESANSTWRRKRWAQIKCEKSKHQRPGISGAVFLGFIG